MNAISDQGILWIANILIHSTVLTAVLLWVAMMFRTRAAMRYWVLCCGLLLVLASPAVSALVQSRGGGWFALALPDSTVPVETGAIASRTTLAVELPAVDAASATSRQDTFATASPLGEAAVAKPIAERAANSRPLVSATVRPEPLLATSADSRSPMQWLTTSVTVVMSVWAVGTGALLLRMGVGWIRLSRILNRANPIQDSSFEDAFARACALAGCHERRRPILVASDEISGPIAAGIFTSAVVLPKRLIAEASPIELADVLVHEVAHVVRRDQIVVLVQNLVAAIYWPHPLVRKLNRELAKAREEVCDNFVLATTEAPIYSRTLLSLAQLVQRPESIPGSVGFFSSRWKLEQRVAGLLNVDRDTQTILSKRGWAFVLASTLGLLTAICFGTVTIATAQNKTAELTDETDSDVKLITVSGVVRSKAGEPVSGARVIAIRNFSANTSWTTESVILQETTTDAAGRYRMQVERDSRRFSDGKSLEQQHLSVLATLPGYGPDEQAVTESDSTTNLQLANARNALSGRIVDLEGRPIEGIRVRLQEIRQPPSAMDRTEMVDKWLSAAKVPSKVSDVESDDDPFGGHPAQPRVPPYPAAERLHGVAALNVETRTNREGQFQIPDIGDDRLAVLRIDGTQIASTLVPVVARRIVAIDTPGLGPEYRTGKTYGSQFQLSAAPTQIVQGIIRDRETGQPISNATISLSQLPDDLRGINGFLSTTSDDRGRYILSGLPLNTKQSGGTIKLTVTPPVDQPYFRSDHPVPVEGGLDPIRFDIQLTRGIWATGRVMESATGKPVSALVGYHPYLDNPNAEDHEAFHLGVTSMGYGEMFATDADGAFRVPALRGRGVLRAIASMTDEFELQEVPGTRTNGIGGFSPGKSKVYHIINPGNAVVEIKVDADGASANAVIELKRVKTLAVSVLNPDGSPATGFRVAGRRITKRVTISGRASQFWEDEPFSTSKFDVYLGDQQERKRPLIVSDSERQMGAVVWLNQIASDQETLVVRMEPNAMIVGKVINARGESRDQSYLRAGELYLRAGVGNAVNVNGMFPSNGGARVAVSRQLRFPMRGVVFPDDSGRFEFSIPPSNRCTLLLKNQPGDSLLLDDESASPGSTIDLGTIDLGSERKAWPKPQRKEAVSRRVGGKEVGPGGQP